MNSTSAVETSTHEVSPAFTLPPPVVYVTTERLLADDYGDVSTTARRPEQLLHEATRSSDGRVASGSSAHSSRYPLSRTLCRASPISERRWRTRTIIALRAEARTLPPCWRYAVAISPVCTSSP